MWCGVTRRRCTGTPSTTAPGHEVAFMVWDGQIAVEYLDGDGTADALLGKRDLVLIEPGQRFRLRSTGGVTAKVSATLGTPTPEPGRWTTAS
jgi:hypothetical protein